MKLTLLALFAGLAAMPPSLSAFGAHESAGAAVGGARPSAATVAGAAAECLAGPAGAGSLLGEGFSARHLFSEVTEGFRPNLDKLSEAGEALAAVFVGVCERVIRSAVFLRPLRNVMQRGGFVKFRGSIQAIDREIEVSGVLCVVHEFIVATC